MAGSGGVSEVRAKFSATINDFKSSISQLRTNLKGIGDSARESVSEANSSFDRFKSNLSSLRGAISQAGAGSSSAFSGLDNAIQGIQREMQETGRVSQSSMQTLERAVQGAESELSTLGSDTDLDLLEREISNVRQDMSRLNDSDLGGIEDEAQQAEDAIEEIGDTAEDSGKRADKSFKNLSGTLLKVGSAVGGFAVVTGAIGGAIKVSEDYQKSLNKVQMATGGTEEETAAYGEALKNIYANNYGEDFADIGQSLSTVAQATGLSGKALEGTTQNALMLRDAFEYDVTESVRATDIMMKQFGISSDEAMTLIAQGAQNGMDKSGDLLDTFSEYSVYFKQLGFDAEGMFDTLKAGSDSGAFNLDKVGDSIKELGIRVKDGSDGTNEAFSSLGMNADDTAAAFAKGGDSAQDALTQTFNALGKIDDPVKRNTIGVALFGTQFEDLEHKTIVAMGNVKQSADMGADTLNKMNEVQFNTVGEALRGIGRSMQVEVIQPIQSKLMPTINNFINKVKQNLPSIKDAFVQAFTIITDTVNKFKPTFESLFTIFKNVGGWLASTLVVAFSALGSILAPIVNVITSIVAKFTEWGAFGPILTGIVAGLVAYKTYITGVMIAQNAAAIATKALTVATKLFNAAMKMNPIGLVIALLVGLGVALYTAYQKSETFRNIVNGVWNAIKSGAMAVFGWLTTNIPLWIDNLVSAWDSFTNKISAVWTWLKTFIATWGIEILAIIAPFLGVPLLIAKHWDTIKSFLVNLWNSIVSIVMPVITGFIEKIKTGFSNLKSNISYILDPIKTMFVNTWNNIKLLVLGIIGVFLNLITGNFKGLKTSLLAIWTAIKNQVVNVVKSLTETAKRLFTVFSSGVKKIFNTLKTTAISVWNGIKSGVVKAATGLKTSATNAITSLKTKAISTFNALKTGATNAVNSMKSKVVSTVNNLRSSFTSAVNKIKSTTTSAFNGAKTAATSAISGMRSSVSSGISRIKSLFTDMKSKIVSTVKGINLKQIGVDMIKGLINGIGSMIGKVKDKVNELAKGVTSKITKVLDIHSPSRVFREIGQFVGQGLAIGIDGTKKLVEKTAGGLADAAIIDPDPTVFGDDDPDIFGGPTDGNGGQGGAAMTTNYQAPLMQIENYYQNDETDARVLSNGLFRLQQDHDRSKGVKTT